ncbi:putative thiamine pyrophosphate-containing protein YdaP [Enhygromyxa salina]|uniref:Putative thiamine pyrophosphate-containing protein YdaP n=1 Tax=Enhygromyxa salina TaxID=215803 RepID=A0A2S9XF12_9BACT|nr:thiamine pyrophosphate-dependent enzyme [Enhygromyxa salina]PRP91261.1 putative thiamine pyrophosphate-containing protein YdaP [Enhygromyxa salina]
MTTGAQALAAVLIEMGVRRAFGVFGGALGVFVSAMHRAGIQIVHARHESGAAFMASEAYFASGSPSAVFTTSGPGATNAITGLVSAAYDGAKVVAVMGATNVPERGRWAFQETAALDLSPWLSNASINYLTRTIESPSQLPSLRQELAAGLARPNGFLANLMFPFSSQVAPAPELGGPLELAQPKVGAEPELVAEVHRRLSSGSFVIWVGYGAREHGRAIVEFAERSGARVMSSPRAKGVFPESHPQYLGVTGMFGGQPRVLRHMLEHQPEHILVLGTRMGETTSCFDEALTPSSSFVHVDIDPSVFGVAYPELETLGVHADVGELLGALSQLWRSSPVSAAPVNTDWNRSPTKTEAEPAGPVDPRRLMAALQRVVVDGSDLVLLADVGNAFAWTTSELRFDQPGRYRIPAGFVSMTQASAGVVGAALASAKPVVALVGDGAMLMGNEVSTAVQYEVPAKWVVLNDSGYGMIRHGMLAFGMEPFETEIPPTDYARQAEALGATGLSVGSAAELEPALERALATPGPVVVDVRIDPDVAAPFGQRSKTMEKLREGDAR